MKKSINLVFKRTIAAFLTIVLVMTCANLSGVADFAKVAFANTGSGQIDVVKGRKYGLSWQNLYGSLQISTYNRSFAKGVNDTNDFTHMLKKYITDGNGDNENPKSKYVPIYRLSRNNGYTSSDESKIVTVKDYIAADDSETLKNKASYLSSKKSDMIRKVLYYGLPQFKNNSKNENCYFMATQAIIWEIEEGKRTGWGNDGQYSGTNNENYLINAKKKFAKRVPEIKASYNVTKNNKSYVFYWHDWYYTQYDKCFKGRKDYYEQILNDCANYDKKVTNLAFTTNNAIANYAENYSRTPNLFSMTSGNAICYEANWDDVYNGYLFEFKLDNSSIGSANGQYSLENLKVQYMYDGSNWTNLSSNEYNVTNSGKNVSLVIKNNSKTNAIKNCQYRLVWKENVSNNDYNTAAFLKTAERDYVNCGRYVTAHTKYLKLMTYVCNVNYMCNINSEYLSSEIVHKGDTPKNVPSHSHSNTSSVDYDEIGWFNGSNNLGTGHDGEIGVKQTNVYYDTTFVKQYNVTNKYSISVYCAYCGQNIMLKDNVRTDSDISLPSDEVWKEHFEKCHSKSEKYSSIENDGCYYSSATLKNKKDTNSFKNGGKIRINENTILYGGYKLYADLTFVCDAKEAVDFYNKTNLTDYDSTKLDSNSIVAQYKKQEVNPFKAEKISLPDEHNHKEFINEDNPVMFVGWAEKIIDSVVYKTDSNGNIVYDNTGNPIVKETKWHYDNYLSLDDIKNKSVALTENKTYYAVYIVNQKVNIDVKIVDLDDFINNNGVISKVNKLKEYNTIKANIYTNADTIDSSNKNANKLYSTATFRTFEDADKSFQNVVINISEMLGLKNAYTHSDGKIYKYKGKYYTDAMHDSTSFYTDVYFTNHKVTKNETIYLLYQKNSKVNVTVKCVDLSEFENNGFSFDNLTSLKESTKSIDNRSSVSSKLKTIDLVNQFGITNTIPIDDTNSYVFSQKYYTNNVLYNPDAYDENKSIVSTDDLNNAKSLNDDFFKSHKILSNETIYVFYEKKAALNLNVKFVDMDKFVSNGYKLDDSSALFQTDASMTVYNGKSYNLIKDLSISTDYEITGDNNVTNQYKYNGYYYSSANGNKITSLNDLSSGKFSSNYFTNHEVSKNETIYLFYKKTQVSALNLDVVLVDYDDFSKNGNTISSLAVIDSYSKKYTLTNTTSKTVNVNTEFNLHEQFEKSITNSDCIFEGSKISYKYSIKGYSLNDASSYKDIMNLSGFNSHTFSQNETIYLFYQKEDVEKPINTTVNVIVLSENENNLYGYYNNSKNKSNLQGSLFYMDKDDNANYDWDGIDTSKITLSTPAALPESEKKEHSCSEIDAKFYSYYQLKYNAKDDTELARLLEDELTVNATISDANGKCDYFLADISEFTTTNDKTLNIVFYADNASKVRYQFVDEDGNPLPNSEVDTLVNEEEIGKLSKSANAYIHNNWYKDSVINFRDKNLTNTYEDVFSNTLEQLSTFNPYNDTGSKVDYISLETNEDGYTNSISVPTSEEEKPNDYFGNNWIVSYFEKLGKLNNADDNDSNKSRFFDIALYTSGNYENNNWELIDVSKSKAVQLNVFAKDFNDISNDLSENYNVGKENFPNNITVKNCFSDLISGNLLVKVTVKETVPPTTINVHYQDKLFENGNDFNTSSFDLYYDKDESTDVKPIDSYSNQELTADLDSKGNYTVFQGNTYTKVTSFTRDDLNKKDKIQTEVSVNNVTCGNLDNRDSTSWPYKYNINKNTIDLYVNKVNKKYNETLVFDIDNNSSSSNAKLRINDKSLTPSVEKFKIEAESIFGNKVTKYYEKKLKDDGITHKESDYTFTQNFNYSDSNVKGYDDSKFSYKPITDKSITNNINNEEYESNMLLSNMFRSEQKAISTRKNGSVRSLYNDLKLNTNWSYDDYSVDVKYYTPTMLYYYIEQHSGTGRNSFLTKLKNPNISESDALDIFCKIFNVKDEDKTFFKEHINDLLFYANYKTYLQKSDIIYDYYCDSTVGYKRHKVKTGYEFQKSYEFYNKDFVNHQVDSNVYSFVRELARKGYDYSLEANNTAISGKNNITIDLGRGFYNTIGNLYSSDSQTDIENNFGDSYYYAMITVSDAPKVTFDMNLPSNNFTNGCSIKEILSDGDFGNNVKITDGQFTLSAANMLSLDYITVFKPITIQDMFSSESSSVDPDELNENGDLINASDDSNCDVSKYQAIGWGSSRDLTNNKHLIYIKSDQSIDWDWIDLENVPSYSLKDYDGDFAHSYKYSDILYANKLLKAFLEKNAEKNSENHYTLYLNWVGLPEMENNDKTYTLDEAQKLDFSTILNQTTKFTASNTQNGTEMKNVTALKNYSNQNEFDKALKSHIKGLTVDNENGAGLEFESGTIAGKTYTSIDEFVKQINSIDENYLKKNGEVYVDAANNEFYKIPCTYNIYYWDDEHNDSYKWTEDGENREVTVNSPKMHAEAITFWVSEQKDNGKEIRFISAKYFENSKKELVPYEDGGLKEGSKWRNNQTLRDELREILNFNSEAKSSLKPQYDFTVSEKEIKDMKKFISNYTDNNGIDSYCDDKMLESVYNTYIVNH